MPTRLRIPLLAFLSLIASPATAFILAFPTAFTAISEPTQTNDAAHAQLIVITSISAPKPTPPPRYVGFLRRQEDEDEDSSSSTLTIDGRTCGFLNGLYESPLACVRSDRTCATSSTLMGCCAIDSDCSNQFNTACIPYDQRNNDSCDGNGQRTLCCESADEPSCISFYLNSTTGFACGTVNVSAEVFTIPTDYTGAVTTVSTLLRSETKEQVLPPPGAIPTSGETTTIGNTNNSVTTGDSLSDDEEHQPSTGAIVGGVVGAVVVFILVIIGVVYFVHRKKHEDNNDQDLHDTPRPPMVYLIPESVYEQPSVPSTALSSAHTPGPSIRHPGNHSPTMSSSSSEISPRSALKAES